jgi:hypothetical protein
MNANTPSITAPSRAFSPRLHGVALAFYALLALLILHPLIFNNGTHVAGYDYFNYHWNQWWIRHALTTPDLSLYESNYVLSPTVNNLGYHALTPFWFPLWALLEPVIGSLTAMNIIIFVGAVLNGYALFAFLRSEGVSPGLALIGGAALQVAPVTRFFYYNTHINLMDWFWLPVHFLLWKQILHAAKARNISRLVAWAVLHGVAVWALFHTDLQFPIFVAFLLVPYGLWTLFTHPNKGRVIVAAVIVVAVTGILLWVAGPLPAILAFEGELLPGTVEDRPGIPFPGGYLSTYDGWWEWDTPTLGGFVTVGMLLSVAVGLSPLRRRLPGKRWLWLALLIPPLLFTMGPDITVAGVTIPMPFRLLHSVTDGMFRFPWRLAPIYLMAGITFCAITWTPLIRGRRVLPVATGLLLVLALDARMFQTGPIEPVLPDYSFYHTMGAEDYDYVVVEAPTGFGTGEILLGDAEAIRFQYYGTIHEKRMINGFLSRVPIDDYWYLRTDDALLSWLGQRRYLEPELVEAQLRERIFEWPIGYIVLHTNLIGVHGPTVQEIVGYLNSLPDLLCPYTVEGAAIVYRTTWHPDGCKPRIPQEENGAYMIDLGNTGDEAFIGWGWHWPEEVAGLGLRWAGEYPQADLYFDLPPADYQLHFTAQAFWEPREVTVLVNGQALGEAVTVETDTLQQFSLALPADVLGDGQNIKLSLVYDAVIVPEEVGQSADTRRLSIALDWLKFEQEVTP